MKAEYSDDWGNSISIAFLPADNEVRVAVKPEWAEGEADIYMSPTVFREMLMTLLEGVILLPRFDGER